MFGLDDLLMFAAINDAEQECERQERIDWCRSEREQIEWEMNHADTYGYNKEDIQQRLDYLEEKEAELE